MGMWPSGSSAFERILVTTIVCLVMHLVVCLYTDGLKTSSDKISAQTHTLIIVMHFLTPALFMIAVYL